MGVQFTVIKPEEWRVSTLVDEDGNWFLQAIYNNVVHTIKLDKDDHFWHDFYEALRIWHQETTFKAANFIRGEIDPDPFLE